MWVSQMLGRIAILLITLRAVAPAADVGDVARLALAIAHVESGLPVDGADVLATAHVETGGTYRHNLVSSASACGVLQVLPKWSAMSCEDMQQPLGGVVAGVVAWNYWQGRARIHSVAAHYNGGNNPGSRAKVYGIAWRSARQRVTSVEPAKSRDWPLIR